MRSQLTASVVLVMLLFASVAAADFRAMIADEQYEEAAAEIASLAGAERLLALEHLAAVACAGAGVDAGLADAVWALALETDPADRHRALQVAGYAIGYLDTEAAAEAKFTALFAEAASGPDRDAERGLLDACLPTLMHLERLDLLRTSVERMCSLLADQPWAERMEGAFACTVLALRADDEALVDEAFDLLAGGLSDVPETQRPDVLQQVVHSGAAAGFGQRLEPLVDELLAVIDGVESPAVRRRASGNLALRCDKSGLDTAVEKALERYVRASTETGAPAEHVVALVGLSDLGSRSIAEPLLRTATEIKSGLQDPNERVAVAIRIAEQYIEHELPAEAHAVLAGVEREPAREAWTVDTVRGLRDRIRRLDPKYVATTTEPVTDEMVEEAVAALSDNDSSPMERVVSRAIKAGDLERAREGLSWIRKWADLLSEGEYADGEQRGVAIERMAELAEALIARGKRDEAIKVFDDALTWNASFGIQWHTVENIVAVAVAQRRLGLAMECDKSFQMAVDASSKWPFSSYLTIGTARLELGDDDYARQLLLMAAEAVPDSDHYRRLELETGLCALGEHDVALATFVEADDEHLVELLNEVRWLDRVEEAIELLPNIKDPTLREERALALSADRLRAGNDQLADLLAFAAPGNAAHMRVELVEEVVLDGSALRWTKEELRRAEWERRRDLAHELLEAAEPEVKQEILAHVATATLRWGTPDEAAAMLDHLRSVDITNPDDELWAAELLASCLRTDQVHRFRRGDARTHFERAEEVVDRLRSLDVQTDDARLRVIQCWRFVAWSAVDLDSLWHLVMADYGASRLAEGVIDETKRKRADGMVRDIRRTE